jgi:hypothetical protein
MSLKFCREKKTLFAGKILAGKTHFFRGKNLAGKKHTFFRVKFWREKWSPRGCRFWMAKAVDIFFSAVVDEKSRFMCGASAITFWFIYCCYLANQIDDMR